MNTKRHISLVLLGMIIILPLFITSCFKKGEQDPFVSMYTRKARVTGVWDVTNMESKIRQVEGDIQLYIETNADGVSWKRKITDIGSGEVTNITGKVLEERNWIKFDNNGKVEQIYEYEYTIVEIDEDSDGEFRTIFKVKEELKGTWNFLAGIDDFKNKERLAIVIEESKSSIRIFELELGDDDEELPIPTLVDLLVTSDRFANGEMSTIWTLHMLKKRDVILHQDVNQFKVSIGEEYTEIGYHTHTLKKR